MHTKTRSKKQLLVWLTIDLVVVAAAAIQAVRWFHPPKPNPPQSVLRWARQMHALDLKVGDEAEDFTLPTLDGGQTVTLSAYRGRKPVVLFFGSLTCPSVREKMAFVNELCEQHRRQAEFLFVYIREAHPAEDGEIPQNQHLSISISTAACLEERAQAAEELHRRFNPKPLVLLDDMYDSVADSYNAWPERFGVVGVDGRIKFTGGTPGELAAMLAAALQRG